MLIKRRKQAIMKEYARFEGHTGSPEGTGRYVDLQSQPADGALLSTSTITTLSVVWMKMVWSSGETCWHT